MTHYMTHYIQAGLKQVQLGGEETEEKTKLHTAHDEGLDLGMTHNYDTSMTHNDSQNWTKWVVWLVRIRRSMKLVTSRRTKEHVEHQHGPNVVITVQPEVSTPGTNDSSMTHQL